MAEVYDLTHIATTQTVGDSHVFAGPQGVSLLPSRFDADHARLWGIEKRIKEIKTSISAYEPSTDIVKNRQERNELDNLYAELAALELAALEPAIKTELVAAVPAPAGKRRHVYKNVLQSDAILAAIKDFNEDPLKLPKRVGNERGIKSKVKELLLKDKQLFGSEAAFNTIWQYMRDCGLLCDA